MTDEEDRDRSRVGDRLVESTEIARGEMRLAEPDKMMRDGS